MRPRKRPWPGYAIEAYPVLDPTEENAGTLLVRLWPSTVTPSRHAGRDVEVVMTRPMLELLARLAQEVGAVHWVDVTDPNDRPDDGEPLPRNPLAHCAEHGAGIGLDGVQWGPRVDGLPNTWEAIRYDCGCTRLPEAEPEAEPA